MVEFHFIILGWRVNLDMGRLLLSLVLDIDVVILVEGVNLLALGWFIQGVGLLAL